MSTSPDTTRPEDRLIGVLSHWLARHAHDAELRAVVEAVDWAELEPAHADAVAELREELTRGSSRGNLEMTVRETLEALALD
jgi:hypothetical protein